MYNDLILDSSYYFYTSSLSSLEECRIFCVTENNCKAIKFNKNYGCYLYSSQSFTFKKNIGWSTYSVVVLNADNSSFIRSKLNDFYFNF